MTGKRVCLTIQEKLWIIKRRDDNQNLKQTKIAVDFQAKFNRPITRQYPVNLKKILIVNQN